MRVTCPRTFTRVAVLGLCLGALQAAPARAAFVVDPTGDTFNTGTIDITGTEVVLGSPTTTIRLQFAGSVAAPSAFAPNSLVGYIDLDTAPGSGGVSPSWGGPVAGGNNWLNFYISTGLVPGPTVALDDEFYIDLGSERFHPGLVDVVDVATDLTLGVAPVTYSGNLVTISVASPLIGSPGGLRYDVLIGGFNAPTDRAPNGADGIAVPAPAGLLLAATGIPALGLFARVRRRAAVLRA